jgi:zinc D-Ala-D-Ala carboxypeptidase
MTDWSAVKNFSRPEFGKSDGVEPDADLVRMLDQARDVAGVPFVINSGIRSVERNAQVGGAPESAHLSGHAVDIHCPTSRQRFLIVQALIEVGFRRIGIGNTFVHADTDPDKAQDVIWTY